MFRVGTQLSQALLQSAARERRLSLTLLTARASALAMAQHPVLNAAHVAMGLVRRDRVDVGIAVELEDGLITPVLRDAAVPVRQVVPVGAAAILAVAAARPEETAVTLRCDHRVVFGADAARLLSTLKHFIETPEEWL
jgi:pyruvate dehydrogenase E2 component (dihydrolipoamide acetyltransferase)